MQQTWTAPLFEEVNLGSEIGTYYEDEDDPSFLFTRKTSIRRRAGASASPTARALPQAEARADTGEPAEEP
jgi:hypothetical protein